MSRAINATSSSQLFPCSPIWRILMASFATGESHDHGNKTDDNYGLGRNYTASVRLNCQFLLWKLELGFNLHPNITLPASPHIADLATGTAVWLLDLKNEVGDAHLDGFDLSLEQCPPLAWLPPLMSLTQWDIYSPVPLPFKERYDVVHIRLLLLVVRDNDPTPILRNVFEMLKPGGYLQWDELNVFEAYVASTDPNVVSSRSFQRAQEVTDLDSLTWVRELGSIMSKTGFEGIQEYKYGCHLALAKYYQDMQFLVMEEQGASTSSIQAPYAESKKGFARCTPKIVMVAKKPK
ncbi:MAG: hypothetical protein Q9225_000745 [Loekoesia sp. 1 TL-2023]